MRTPFFSFMQGGFECSCHRFPDGRQLDLIASTHHDLHAMRDYAAAAHHGLRTVRDGVRWHRVAATPGAYDWRSLLPQVAAANANGVQVIWDLCHYGWPHWLDIWSPRFPEAFARFAGATARLLREESALQPMYCPINEMSYWSWAAGDMAHFGPMAYGRGRELKRQLARAAIQASAAIQEVDPGARLITAEPLIAVHPGIEDDPAAGDPAAGDPAAGDPAAGGPAAAHEANQAQFEAWDMVAGRSDPDLGGHEKLLDVVAVNFYPHNQWRLNGPTVWPGEAGYRPLRALLQQVHDRYDRPVLLAETGAEGDARAPWLAYVADEVVAALGAGVPVAGICLYPVTDYPGWEDDRHCPTGLLGLADGGGERQVHPALSLELRRQTERFRLLRRRDVSRAAPDLAGLLRA